MTEHPYEIGGILFTIAIICGLLGGIASQQMGAADFLLEIDNEMHKAVTPPSGSGVGGTWAHNYYEDNNNQQLDCKKSAISLQEFYECVNNP